MDVSLDRLCDQPQASWFHQVSCALTDSSLGPLSSAATPPAASSRPGSASSPARSGDVLEPRGHEHERGVHVGEGADHADEPADLAVEPLVRVVGAYAPPVLAREARVGQGLRVSVPDRLGVCCT